MKIQRQLPPLQMQTTQITNRVLIPQQVTGKRAFPMSRRQYLKVSKRREPLRREFLPEPGSPIPLQLLSPRQKRAESAGMRQSHQENMKE